MPTVDFNLVPVATSTDFELGYGPLFNQSFTAINGDTIDLTIGKKGYTGTTYSDDVAEYNFDQGALSETTLTIRRSSLGTVQIQTKSTALIQALKAIPGSEARDYRLTVTRAGTTEFQGWVIPSATTTRINENRLQLITVRAKDRILSLDQDYDLRGENETVAYSIAIADVLKTVGLNFDMTVQMAWRPDGMAQTDDPLSIQVPCSAWYRTDTDGVQRALTRGEVLDDLIGTLGCQIVQKGGVWTIQQPAIHRSGSTVETWTYDSTGTLQSGPTSRTTTVDITSESWIVNSDEQSAGAGLKASFVEYEHNAPDFIDFNGSFDDISNGEPVDWVWWANDGAQETFGTNFQLETGEVDDGTRALEIEGSQAPSATTDIADFPQYAERFGEIPVGFVADSAGGIDFSISARYRYTDSSGSSDPIVEPGASQTFWALRHNTDAGDYYWVEGDGWTLEGNLTSSDDKKNPFAPIQLAGNYQEETFSISELPDIGTLYLRVYEPVARPQDTGSADDDDFRVFCLWDGGTMAPQKTPTGVTTYYNYDAANASGDEQTFVTRLGDGPYAGSAGALVNDQGITTGRWTEAGSSIEYELGELLAKRRMALLRRDPATLQLSIFDATTVPEIDRAVTFDGTRYWPLSIKRREPAGLVEVYVAELVNQGYPSGYEAYSGRAELVQSGGSPTSGAAPVAAPQGVSSFNNRTGNVELSSTDVTDALGYTPQDSSSPGVTALDGKQGDIEVESGVLDIPDTSPPTLQIVAGGIDPAKTSFISVDTGTTPDTYTIPGNLVVEGYVDADGEVSAFDSGPGSSSGSGAGTIAVEDSGVSIATDVSTINFGTNATVTDDGSGQVTVDISASASAPVDSVFGRTGTVTAQSGDYSASQISGFDTAASDAAPVQTVFGRSGTVTAQSGDYEAAQITSFDTAAVDAVNAESTLSVNISGTANDADNLGGQPPSSYARTDIAETFSGAVTIEGYTFEQDGGGNLTITTPSSNIIKFYDNGDIEAFA